MVVLFLIQANCYHHLVFPRQACNAVTVCAWNGICHLMCLRILPSKNHRFRKGGDLRMSRLSIGERVFDATEIAFAVSINCQYLAHRHSNHNWMVSSAAEQNIRHQPEHKVNKHLVSSRPARVLVQDSMRAFIPLAAPLDSEESLDTRTEPSMLDSSTLADQTSRY